MLPADRRAMDIFAKVFERQAARAPTPHAAAVKRKLAAKARTSARTEHAARWEQAAVNDNEAEAAD